MILFYFRFEKDLLTLFSMYECFARMDVCVLCMPAACSAQKRALHPRELELQAVGSYPLVPATESGSSERTENAGNC